MSRLIAGLTVVVTTAWVISFLAPIVQPDYKPPPEINVVMMAIVGFFVQLYLKSRRPTKGPDDE